MSIGEERASGTSLKELLENAAAVMTKERIGIRAGGQAAYDEWAGALSDESQFPKDAILPMLFERIMCQNDAMVMIAEGRTYAAFIMEWVGEQNPQLKTNVSKLQAYSGRRLLL